MRFHRLVFSSFLISSLAITVAPYAAPQSSEDTQSSPTFGFGREPTPDEVEALDIDVMPDGTGLPEGGGTAREGEAIYLQKCAACHGVTGTEGPNDRLVGREPSEDFPFGRERGHRKTIGNYWPYATTIFDYTYRAMPFDEPGSLTADEVYSLVAFLLYKNEIIAQDDTMNAETLPKVIMPAHDRFVPDNRSGGPELK